MMPPSETPGASPLSSMGTSTVTFSPAQHAEQIDVEHVLKERVPLDVLQQCLAAGGAVEVDDLRAVAERSLELVGGERKAHRFFAVAVQDGRRAAGAAEPFVVSFPECFA